MKCNYLLISDYAALDAGGKVMILGIFDTIYTQIEPKPDKPVVHPSLSVAFEVQDVEKEKGVAELVLEDSSGKQLIKNAFDYEIKPGSVKKITGVIKFNLVALTSLGAYALKLYVDHQLSNQVNLNILKK